MPICITKSLKTQHRYTFMLSKHHSHGPRPIFYPTSPIYKVHENDCRSLNQGVKKLPKILNGFLFNEDNSVMLGLDINPLHFVARSAVVPQFNRSFK